MQHKYKTLQSDERQCRAMHCNAKQCTIVEGNAGQGNTMEGSTQHFMQCSTLKGNAEQIPTNLEQCKT